MGRPLSGGRGARSRRTLPLDGRRGAARYTPFVVVSLSHLVPRALFGSAVADRRTNDSILSRPVDSVHWLRPFLSRSASSSLRTYYLCYHDIVLYVRAHARFYRVFLFYVVFSPRFRFSSAFSDGIARGIVFRDDTYYAQVLTTDSMKSIALRAAVNKTYYGGYVPTDLSGYAAAARCRSPAADDMDDISVGRPSPPASPECYARLHADEDDGGGDSSDCGVGSSGREEGSSDYFEPLKKLGTVQIDKVSYGISDRKNYAAKRRRQSAAAAAALDGPTGRFDGLCSRTTTIAGTAASTVAADDGQPAAGVKSFSIADILSHEPSTAKPAADDAAKIVRPWTEEYQPSAAPCSSFVPPPPPPPAHRQPVVGALFPHSLFIQHLQQQQQQQHHHHHHLQQQQQQQHHHHHHHQSHQHRPKSADYETSTCTSGRSSTDGSECCTSPEIASCTQSNPSSAVAARKQQAAGGKNNDNSSPLDALFQMTSKTFDQLHGDPSAAGKFSL